MAEIISKKAILEVVENALAQQVVKRVGETWSNPLNPIIDSVISENEDKLKTIMRSIFNEALNAKEFAETLRNEMMRKLAKNLVGKLEGGFEKAMNDVRQDPTMRAKLVVAVTNLIDEVTV